MKKRSKSKANKILLFLGILFLIIGFIPNRFFSYHFGIVVFLFCLVAIAVIKVAVPDAEEPPEDNEPGMPIRP